MYHYIGDKQFLSDLRDYCGNIMQDLSHELAGSGIGTTAFLVGSGGRNLITQNEKLPIDLDYNLNIQKCANINDGRTIKNAVIKAFNKVLRAYGLSNCEDSTSSITTKLIVLKSYPKTQFKIDICIVSMNSDGTWRRLIHEKTGNVSRDRFYWSEAPHSKNVRSKTVQIKDAGYWALVRDEYLKVKNSYLKINDHNHPAFVCYFEAVNNVYNTLRQKRFI